MLGFLDYIENNTAYGWAQGDTNVTVYLYYNNSILGKGIANLPRVDLKTKCAFKIPFQLPYELRDIDCDLITAKTAQENFTLPKSLSVKDINTPGCLKSISDLVKTHPYAVQKLSRLTSIPNQSQSKKLKNFKDALMSVDCFNFESIKTALQKLNFDVLPLGPKIQEFFRTDVGDSHTLLPDLNGLELYSLLDKDKPLKKAENFIWWFVSAYMPLNKIKYSDIFPDDPYKLKEGILISPNHIFKITRYDFMAWENNEGYRRKYNIYNSLECALFCLDRFLTILDQQNFTYHEEFLFSDESILFWLFGHGYDALHNFVTVNLYPQGKWSLSNIKQAFRYYERKTWEDNFFTSVVSYNNDTGLNQNAVMSSEALYSLGLSICNIDADTLITKSYIPDTEFNFLDKLKSKHLTNKNSWTLYHINADPADKVAYKLHLQGHNPGKQIGFFLWELDNIPESHKPILELLDEIWVPTNFVGDIYRKHFKGNVRVVGKGLPNILPQHFSRASIGVRETDLCYLIAFDPRSSIARKNPLAAVKAFNEVFKGNDKVKLIIKTLPVTGDLYFCGDPENQLKQILEICEKNSNIKLVDKQMSISELFGLMSTIDCYVSTHRAEGFGYFAAYASLLKKATIFTNYSGICDFLDYRNSFPIKYQMIPVVRNWSSLNTNSEWAEIDFRDLKGIFRSTHFLGKHFLKSVGNLAYDTVKEKYSMQTYRNTLEKALMELDLVQ